jgi:hypothetical protein
VLSSAAPCSMAREMASRKQSWCSKVHSNRLRFLTFSGLLPGPVQGSRVAGIGGCATWAWGMAAAACSRWWTDLVVGPVVAGAAGCAAEAWSAAEAGFLCFLRFLPVLVATGDGAAGCAVEACARTDV